MRIRQNILTILFVIIIFLGAILRLWNLGNVPLSPDWDEVALGYDAYSIMQTGKDEYGEFLPPVLRSYDDYKPALYTYLTVPSVGVFGLNTFAVRLPSAIMGIVALIGFYFLVLEICKFKDKSFPDPKRQAEIIALLSTFLLAISPWHIQFSRVGFETNVGLTFNILFVLFFLKSFKKNWYLLLAALFAGMNFSVYQSERVFTPLLLIALISIYHKHFFKISKKILVTSLMVGLLTILPLTIYISNHSQAFKRVQATSVLGVKSPDILTGIDKLYDDTKMHNYIGMLFDNRRVVYTKEIISGYLSHFDANWLFIKGDANRHHAPFMGLLYIVTLPFILLGMYLLLFGNYDKKMKLLIFAWFLLAPLPASITYEVPHAVRTLNEVPIYQLLAAIGLLGASIILKKHKKILFGSFIVIIFAITFNFIYFLNQYFVQQNYFYASDWQYGYKETITKVENSKQNYRKIVVSDSKYLDRSYMFFLFYLKYSPQMYQANSQTSHAFDKYEFRTFNWAIEKKNKDVLYVGSPEDFPGEVKTLDKIMYPKGNTAFMIVDPKNN